MTASRVDLTIEVRSGDGSNTEFYQNDPKLLARALRVLVTPRLFTQPFLVLASEHNVSTIPCRTIDLILARTAAPVQLAWPAELLDVSELCEPGLDNEPEESETDFSGPMHTPAPSTTPPLELRPNGPWPVRMTVRPDAQPPFLD